MQNEFTLSQIIMGLRSEYLLINLKLNRLKQYMILSNNDVDVNINLVPNYNHFKFNFDKNVCICYPNDVNKMYLEYVYKLNNVVSLLTYYLTKRHKVHSSLIYQEGSSVIDGKYPVYLDGSKDFNQDLKEITNNEHTKNMALRVKGYGGLMIDITPNRLSLNKNDSSIVYKAFDDSLSISTSKNINHYDVGDILKTRINSKCFSGNLSKIIDSYKHKDITLEEIKNPSKNIKYYLKSDVDNIILTRKKNY